MKRSDVLRLNRVRELWALLEVEQPGLRERLVEVACMPASIVHEDDAALRAVQVLRRFVDAHTPLADGLDRKAVATERAELLYYLMDLAGHHASDEQILDGVGFPAPWETEAGRRLVAHIQTEEPDLLTALRGFRDDLAAAFFDETYQDCLYLLIRRVHSAPFARNMNGEDLTSLVVSIIRFTEQGPPLNQPEPCLTHRLLWLWWRWTR